MSIDVFPTDLQQFIQGRIEAGEFTSVDDFAVAAAQLYRQSLQRHAELRDTVQTAIREIEAGNGIDISEPQSREALAARIKSEGRDRMAARE